MSKIGKFFTEVVGKTGAAPVGDPAETLDSVAKGDGVSPPSPGGKSPPAKTPPAPPNPKTQGVAGDYGTTVYKSGDYVISFPPFPAGTYPLLVLFAGDTGKDVIIAATPASTYKTAIVVVGGRFGTTAGFQAALDKLLGQNMTSVGTISVCGYSSGGQAAFANYGYATKAVGLIDPNIKTKNFAKFDGKTILSINGSTIKDWNFKDDPPKKGYTVGHARLEAVDLVKNAGGFAELTSVGHGGYPAYFLKQFEGKLI